MVLKVTVSILFIGPIENVLILLNLKTVFGITTIARYSQNIWRKKGRPISRTELHYRFTLFHFNGKVCPYHWRQVLIVKLCLAW
jgi:hypothetical protein